MPNFWSQFLSNQIRSQLWFDLPNTDLLNFDPKYWPYELGSQILTYRSQILTYFDLIVDPNYWCNLKYWPNSAICCALCFQALSSQSLQILNLFGIKLPKSVFGIDAIPINNLNWRYAQCCVSIHSQHNDTNIEFIRHYDFKISIWDWRNPKHWPDSAICCVLYFHTQVFARGIHGSFVGGIHWLFETCLKVCLWNPWTYTKLCAYPVSL